jgi:hypothetical protein
MRETPLVIRRLDLAAIETTLLHVQRNFPRLNSEMDAERSFFHHKMLSNMVAGYRYVDTVIAARVNLFASGHSKAILELNNIVLYGTDPQRRIRYSKSLEYNEKHFYQQGGIGELMDAYQMHRHESVWKQAAIVYLHMVSQPQLFVEGNNRTGTLLMSYLLVRKGKPPFVLTVDNAKSFFHPSAMIGKSKRHSITMFFYMQKLKHYFARLLKEEANPHYLLPPSDNERVTNTHCRSAFYHDAIGKN